jgi:hypothetical protein
LGNALRRVAEGEELGRVCSDLKEIVVGSKHTPTRLNQRGMGFVEAQLRDRHTGGDQ